MKHIVDPKQTRLFDPYEAVFSEMAYQRLADGWQGAFRHVILELMPAHELGEHFHKIMGRPTKELYAVAGLLFIKEFMGWTPAEATLAFMFHSDIQYALNLEPAQQSMCTRTFERYEELLRDDDLAIGVMDKVTTRMAEVLELKIEQQRLDSTHVFSDMATFGRTRLLGVAIKRFLTQVKRHAAETYAGLPEELRQRYEPSVHQLFGHPLRPARLGDYLLKLCTARAPSWRAWRPRPFLCGKRPRAPSCAPSELASPVASAPGVTTLCKF